MDEELKNALQALREATASMGKHEVRCDGRDDANKERFKAIWDRLKVQDRILWAILSMAGTLILAVITGLSVVAWDIFKIKVLHAP